jgi:membrane protease YdiL (CAAX protease family)
MNLDRLRGRDLRFVAVCLVLLGVTTWFSVRNFYRAFPEASIDFRVHRSEGEHIAAQFLSERGYRVNGYRVASSFAYDDTTKTFLEREAGLEQANRIMGTRVRLWRWSYRWFQPLQKEEFRVDVTPRGELAGFEHQIPEDAARPAAGAAQARALAEEFLRVRMSRDPSSLEFVEASDRARPNRIDRTFTWKERDFNLREATNRVEVTVLGNEVGGYREHLKVPETWTRDYQRLRSKNEVTQLVDTALMAVMLVGLLIVIVLRVRRHDIRWRRAAVIGVAGMALQFCAQLNQFPLDEFQYPTTDSYSSFLARQLLGAIIGALAAGGLLFVLAAGAEPLYREACRNQISIGNLFRLRGLRTRRFFLGSILGITLTGIFVAYQTAFYLVAYKFGAWSPADVPYSDLLNTRFPWLFVLIGGYLPAFSEELLFRMFAIPFLKKLLRSMVVALVLAGFIWGFGHSGYPQQPFYIRGVEVGIGGVVLGLIMLRWGILPALVWHYSVDAMYTAMLLLRSESLYFRLSGAASAGVIVVPVLVALVAYWRRGGFIPETGMLNADEGTVEAPPETAPAESVEAARFDYRRMGAGARTAAAGIFVLGLMALLIPADRFGEAPRFRITSEQARAPADAFVRGRGLNPDVFRHVTFPEVRSGGNDGLTVKYFLERRSPEIASRFFEENRPIRFWATRYFRSLDREEISVTVHPETGKVLSFLHTIPEDRAGADISPDEARATAATFAAAQGWDLSRMELKENSSEKKKARRDYTLEWEAPASDPRTVGEARFRVHMEVSGDRVTAMRTYWKLPEAYVRGRSRQNFISIAVMTLQFGTIAAGVVCGILLLVQAIRRGNVRWGPAIRIGVPVSILTIVGPLLSSRLILKDYNTAIPLETYQAMMYVALLVSLVFGFVLLGGAVALVTSYFPDSLRALGGRVRRLLGADGLAALLAAAGLGLLLQKLHTLLLDRFHPLALYSIDAPNLIVSAAPALAAFAGALRTTLVYAALFAVVVLVLERLPRTWMRWPILFLAGFTSLSLDIRTPGEFALEYLVALATLGAAAAFCFRFARRNYLAYALVFWAMALRGPLNQLFLNPAPSLRVHAWILVGTLAGTVIWAVWPSVAGRPERPPSTTVLPKP